MRFWKIEITHFLRTRLQQNQDFFKFVRSWMAARSKNRALHAAVTSTRHVRNEKISFASRGRIQ